MRAILWDFDGTLAWREGMWAGCLVEVLDAEHPGHGLSRDDFRPALRNGFPWHRADAPHHELSSPDAWWAHVEVLLAGAFASVGYPGDLACAVRARYLDPLGWQLFDDTLPTLTTLRARGFRHVILSNHVPELTSIVGALALDGLIDGIVNSAVTGYEKPHPEAFAAARRAAGEPAELWMVGDNPIADVQGAEAVGIPAILVRREGGVTLAEAAIQISQNESGER